VRRGSARHFARLRGEAGIDLAGPWFCRAGLPDGGEYLRWAGLFEFSVSADGATVDARALGRASIEAFGAYLLQQVLSFSLLKRGVEPLHATAVALEGRAIALLGDCGYGKSTLGAALVGSGGTLLTDDLLVLSEAPSGFRAHAGPPRIKLFPGVADRVLPGRPRGSPMNNLTAKRVIPLGRAPIAPVPLGAIFLLVRPSTRGRGDRITVRRLAPRRACLELIRSTFNAMVVEPPRLARQLDLAARVAARVPVFSLSYPRRLSRLPAVARAVTSRLAG
jgi:hypothetical protein